MQEDSEEGQQDITTRRFKSTTKLAGQHQLSQVNAVTRSMTSLKNQVPTGDRDQKARIRTTKDHPAPSLLSTGWSQKVGSDIKSIELMDVRLAKIKEQQQNDKLIQEKIKQVNKNSAIPDLTIVDGILYKLVNRGGITKRKLPFIPTSTVQQILSLNHDHPLSGHFGTRRTFNKIKDEYYWPQMFDTVQDYVRSCEKCAKFNVKRTKSPGFLQPVPPPEGVFEVLHMDFWGPTPVPSVQENRYVLVFTDSLSKFVFAKALPTNTAKVAAETLMENVIIPHGTIKCLASDQGSHFNNELLRTITTLIGVKQSFSIPHHPQSNGQVERFNATFGAQLAKYQDGNINDWDEYLQAVVSAYNSGIHSTTGFTPYELAFGRKFVQPFGSTSTAITMSRPHDYFEKVKRFRIVANNAARFNIQQQQKTSKQRYDKGRKHSVFAVGDLLWVKVINQQSKLDARYEGPYTIIEKLSEVKYLVKYNDAQHQQVKHISDMIPLFQRQY
ncbi:unnamed protein product [Didymodactylos carnosus]|nr:unnamed protein product [Didymodactylos carnosus]CAF3982276.1 unnamed protein product [Didymodactylos carnosus]